ncbi:TS-1 [Ecytonucleospora hepatopenaei]|uniref:thymidylate synthase n=1 Tax=Ecytonucleospora hepatopenaei TaxID=646526 RepID=A0A1W0E382_9MICR|nr:TS-1 [Ecytonucleospora hepatopenaei]
MVNNEEKQYLQLIKRCIEEGEYQDDRTGTGTYGIFGTQMRYSLENNAFPLLTTKKTAYKSILEELLFFIRGQTDNKILMEKGVKIWNGNSTKEYFEKVGINREANDLGPVYGFQWRHYGAPYETCKTNYEGKGIDQLRDVIEQIKTNPTSRRLIVCAWNPLQLKEMALPPCHTLFHFKVYGNKLSCILYQRSGDVGLGVPFNIASYALLTIIVAKLTNLEPSEFIHFIGDTHVYKDHVEPLKEQLDREPFDFPKMRLKEKTYEKLEDFEFEDFILEDYKSHGPIKMNMSV